WRRLTTMRLLRSQESRSGSSRSVMRVFSRKGRLDDRPSRDATQFPATPEPILDLMSVAEGGAVVCNEFVSSHYTLPDGSFVPPAPPRSGGSDHDRAPHAGGRRDRGASARAGDGHVHGGWLVR